MSAKGHSGLPYPRVSIIIATYNCADQLQGCITSIVGQTARNWEILLADGGSTDGTVDVIRANQECIAYWRSEQDRGIYDAWNRALAHATGEYVCFLGADDRLHSEDAFASVFSSVGSRGFELITSRGLLVNQFGQVIEEFGRPWDHQRLRKRMTICHPGAMHRRELFDRFGGFDTRYRICADYDFLLRLPEDLATFHVDLPLVDVADGGISRDRRMLMLKERFQIQARCPRVGRIRAAWNLLDKLWRIPVARAMGIPN